MKSASIKIEKYKQSIADIPWRTDWVIAGRSFYQTPKSRCWSLSDWSEQQQQKDLQSFSSLQSWSANDKTIVIKTGNGTSREKNLW